jgi:hypothetical protein
MFFSSNFATNTKQVNKFYENIYVSLKKREMPFGRSTSPPGRCGHALYCPLFSSHFFELCMPGRTRACRPRREAIVPVTARPQQTPSPWRPEAPEAP